MNPTLKEGDLVLYRPIKKSILSLKKGSIVIAINPLKKDELMIKRVSKRNDLEIDLLGDNPNASIDSRHFGSIKLDQLIGIADQIIPKI